RRPASVGSLLRPWFQSNASAARRQWRGKPRGRLSHGKAADRLPASPQAEAGRMPPIPVRRTLARLVLVIAALVCWSDAALAQIRVEFHSFNGSFFGSRFPHTF